MSDSGCCGLNIYTGIVGNLYCNSYMSSFSVMSLGKRNEARDPVMSSSSTVTYTSVYTDSEPGRVFWGADEELSDGGSPRVLLRLSNLMDSQCSRGPAHLPADALTYRFVTSYVARLQSDEDSKEDPEGMRKSIWARRDDDGRFLHIAHVLVLHQFTPTTLTVDSPTYDEASLGYRVVEIRLRASSIPIIHYHYHHYLPPHIPTSLPLPSSPLPPLPASLFIPPPVDRREDIPEAELPPRKRRQRAKEVGYGIRDVWVDLAEAVEEVAPMTLEGVNARVTELTVVQEQDTQDIYAVIEDAQDRQTQLS
ncbi:hypothetical protein Tco_0689440 [Tanacetum coccineum]